MYAIRSYYEELKDIVAKLDDLELLYQKVHSMEIFLNRFKKLGDLIMHLQKIEKSTYMLVITSYSIHYTKLYEVI